LHADVPVAVSPTGRLTSSPTLFTSRWPLGLGLLGTSGSAYPIVPWPGGIGGRPGRTSSSSPADAPWPRNDRVRAALGPEEAQAEWPSGCEQWWAGSQAPVGDTATGTSDAAILAALATRTGDAGQPRKTTARRRFPALQGRQGRHGHGFSRWRPARAEGKVSYGVARCDQCRHPVTGVGTTSWLQRRATRSGQAVPDLYISRAHHPWITAGASCR